MADNFHENNIPELQSPFEQLREVDADGKEWWNSRKLARVMGYGKYWNFERVIAKAQAWTSQKGYHLREHFVEITEMAELGSGAVREVKSFRLYVNRPKRPNTTYSPHGLSGQPSDRPKLPQKGEQPQRRK